MTKAETNFETGSEIDRTKGTMKNRLLKLAYALTIPAIVTLLAISCSASAVWGS